MNAFSDYFCLTKDSFSLDPWRDAEVYFGSQRPQDQIMDRVKQDFVAPRSVPKFFILGRYGAGKTHSLAHIAYELKTSDLASDFPTETIYIEIGPIKSKDQWSTVHRRILDAIGLSRLRNAVNAVITKHGNAGDVLAALRQAEVLRYGEESLRQSQGQIFRRLSEIS